MKTPKYTSNIPANCEERFISPYREEKRCTDNGCSGAAIWYERREYWLDGELRGIRQFDKDESLADERPILDGKTHGICYRWYREGTLEYIDEWKHGLRDGLCQQWAPNGDLMGSTTFVAGTGYDLWYHPYLESEKEGYYLSEFYGTKAGMMHGFEWWFNEDQQSIWDEKHYWENEMHGICRQWQDDGRLAEGYPKYFIHDEEVDQASYLKACLEDPSLPKFRQKDQSSQRVFPAEIQHFLSQ